MRLVVILASVSLFAVAAACGSGSGNPADSGPDAIASDTGDDMAVSDGVDVRDAAGDVSGDAAVDTQDHDDVTTDTGNPDAADIVDAADANDASDAVGPYVRPERGEPVPQAEIDRITDVYIDILKKTRYFDVLDERVHGWPRSDAEQRYWYGTWWSGIRMIKADGKMRYLHSADGADNNGMRTGPMLVGTCYALKLWGKARDLDLTRRIVRGFNSWAMVFRSPTFPDWETTQVLSRAAYPAPITSTDGGREIYIDYSQNLPGEDNGACQYVHVPDNPYWGDIWAKNRRSKDDIGHMMIALAMLDSCMPAQDETDPEAVALRQDIDESMSIYRAWAEQVDRDEWKIATVDKDGTIYYPEEDLGYLWLSFGNIECEAATTLRLFHGGDPADLKCGNGICEAADEMEGLKNDFHQIQRSFHEAAVAHAQMAGRMDVAWTLMDGLAWRVDFNLDRLESDTPPANPNLSDIGELVMMAANTGVPMTWRDVRFLHARIEQAYAALVGDRDEAALKARYDVFSPDVPDGEYPFDPGDTGLAWRNLGAVLGACASPYWNADSKQLLNCEKIRNAVF